MANTCSNVFSSNSNHLYYVRHKDDIFRILESSTKRQQLVRRETITLPPSSFFWFSSLAAAMSSGDI